jgi:hypothetical protein
MPCKQARQATTTAEACQLEITLVESRSPMWRRQLVGILACRRIRDLREKTSCFVNPQLCSDHAP